MTSLAGKLGRLLLAAALLAGGHAALVHPLQHVDDHGELVHAGGGHDSHEHEGGEASVQCDAIAAVACVVAGAAPALHGPVPGGERIASFVSSPASPALVSPSSRDPPTLL